MSNDTTSRRSRRADKIALNLIICLMLLAPASISLAPSTAAQERYYEPLATAEILLSAHFTDDEFLWAEQPFLMAPPNYDGVVFEIAVDGAGATLTYAIYPDPAALAQTRYLDRGFPIRAERFQGRQAIMIQTNDGRAEACTAEFNLMICAASNTSRSQIPDRAAVLAASGGLIRLLRAAEPGALPPTGGPQTDHAYFDPPSTTVRLLHTPFLPDDFPAPHHPEVTPPSAEGGVNQIQIPTGNALLIYGLFPGNTMAADTGYLQGSPILSEAFLGRPAVTFPFDGGTEGACTAELNILICVYSDPRVSPDPAGTAVDTAAKGLAHLLRVAPSELPAAAAAAPSTVTRQPQSEQAMSPPSAQTVPGSRIPNLDAVANFPIPNAACFAQVDAGSYDQADVTKFLRHAGVPNTLISTWTWLEGKYLVFVCDTPIVGGANEIDIMMHSFGSSYAARSAVRYFVDAYQGVSNEARFCDSSGNTLVCVAGRSPGSPPTDDVSAVLQHVLALVE